MFSFTLMLFKCLAVLVLHLSSICMRLLVLLLIALIDHYLMAS